MESFENIAGRHGLETIKTIGDCFMAAAGLCRRSSNPAVDAVRCGLDMIEAARAHSAGWKVRVGVNVGPVVGGVVGCKKNSNTTSGARLLIFPPDLNKLATLGLHV